MMKKISKIVSFFLLLSVAGFYCQADEIVMKSGKSLTGRIVEETDQYVVVVTPVSTVKVWRDNIAEIKMPKEISIEELEGDAAVEEDRLDEALKNYKLALQTGINEEEVRRKIEKARNLLQERLQKEFKEKLVQVNALVGEQKFDEALNLLDSIKSELSPEASEAIINEQQARIRYYQAKQALNMIDYAGAEQRLKQSIELDNDYFEAHLLLAEIIEDDITRRGQAVAEYLAALRSGAGKIDTKTRAKIVHALGSLYYEDENLEEAIKYLNQAINLMPEEYESAGDKIAQAYLRLAQIAQGTKNQEETETLLKKALAVRPFFMPALMKLANLYIEQERYREAIEQLNNVVKVDPSIPGVHYLLSTCYREIEAYDTELLELEKELAVNPDNYEALCAMGEYYLRGANYKETLSYCKKAQEIDPNRSRAYVNLGKAYRFLGQQQLALENLKKALEINPQQREAIFELASLYKELKEYEKALLLFDNVIASLLQEAELDDSEVDMLANAYNSRGDIEISLARPRTAIGNFEHALAYRPDNAESYYLLGEAYIKLQRYQEAERNLLKAIRISPELAKYYLKLGILYHNFLKQPDKAVANYQQYILLGGPDFLKVNKWIEECGGKTIIPERGREESP